MLSLEAKNIKENVTFMRDWINAHPRFMMPYDYVHTWTKDHPVPTVIIRAVMRPIYNIIGIYAGSCAVDAVGKYKEITFKQLLHVRWFWIPLVLEILYGLYSSVSVYVDEENDRKIDLFIEKTQIDHDELIKRMEELIGIARDTKNEIQNLKKDKYDTYEEFLDAMNKNKGDEKHD